MTINQKNRIKPFASLVFGILLVSFALAASAEMKTFYQLSEADSQIIKFEKPLKRALITNADLASVKVLGKNELLISGKAAGRTRLIVTFREQPAIDHHITLDFVPDESRREEIETTLSKILADLNPDGTVKFELKHGWLDSHGAVRRQVDQIGNQIDGESPQAVEGRKDQNVLQSESASGSLNIKPLAGNYVVLLSGHVKNKAQKKRINAVISVLGLSVINMINVTGPQQVKLSVRVAEVVKGNPFRSGFAFGDKTGRTGIFNSSSASQASNFLSTISGVTSAGLPYNDSFYLGAKPDGSALFGVLSILESNDLARVLAKPELIVQSGETAEFLVGGEVPIPVAQSKDTITVEYKEFGIRLRFSPIITASGQIQMTVAPEVSNIDSTASYQVGTISIPGFRSRKTNTTVTIKPGQSFVVGGLIQDELRSSVSKIPLLGDIPILGTLFRSTSYENDKSELAVLVTADFVEPIDKGRKILLPGENLARPSNFDGFFNGKIAELLPEGKSVLPELSVKVGLEKP